MDKFNELLRQKKQCLETNDDVEKYEYILELIKDEGCFFNMPMDIVFGILEFLGIEDENEALDIYFDLISIDNFRNNFPKQRILFD